MELAGRMLIYLSLGQDNLENIVSILFIVQKREKLRCAAGGVIV